MFGFLLLFNFFLQFVQLVLISQKKVLQKVQSFYEVSTPTLLESMDYNTKVSKIIHLIIKDNAPKDF